MKCELQKNLELLGRELNFYFFDPGRPSSHIDKDILEVDEAGERYFLDRATDKFYCFCYLCWLRG